MKLGHWIVSACLAMTILATGLLLAESEKKETDAKKPVNTKCPVSGKDVDATKTFTYSKVIGFCCNNCKGKFEKDPEKSLEKVAKIKAKHVNTKCPVSGKDVDASKTFTHNGEIVAFCCGNCQGKFEKEPAAYAAKVKRDNPSNDKCIMSGEDIDATKVAVYKKVVGFCCGNCQAKFAKEADKHIEKVK